MVPMIVGVDDVSDGQRRYLSNFREQLAGLGAIKAGIHHENGVGAYQKRRVAAEIISRYVTVEIVTELPDVLSILRLAGDAQAQNQNRESSPHTAPHIRKSPSVRTESDGVRLNRDQHYPARHQPSETVRQNWLLP